MPFTMAAEVPMDWGSTTSAERRRQGRDAAGIIAKTQSDRFFRYQSGCRRGDAVHSTYMTRSNNVRKLGEANLAHRESPSSG